MAYPPLVTVQDLPAGPGAPSQDDLDVIADDVRAHCGWHIAPEVTETLTLDSNGADVLVLPTLALNDVTAVRYWNGSEMVPLSGWDTRTGWSSESSTIRHAGGFPRGRRMLEVDVRHGYETVPKSLVAGLVRLLAGPGAADVASESLPGHAVTYRGTTAYTSTVALLASGGALARYRLGPRP